MTKEVRRIVLTVGLTLLIFFVIGQLLIVLFIGGSIADLMREGFAVASSFKLKVMLGYGLGILVSFATICHITYLSIHAMERAPSNAASYIGINTTIRRFVLLVLMVIAVLTRWFDALGIIAGLMMFKPATMIASSVHNRFIKGADTDVNTQGDGVFSETSEDVSENTSGNNPIEPKDADLEDWEENPPAFVKWLERKTYKHDGLSKFK